MRGILISLCAMLGVYEIVALVDPTAGDTISASTRALFHTDTVVGRCVWFSVWGTFSAWFAFHIGRWHVLDRWN